MVTYHASVLEKITLVTFRRYQTKVNLAVNDRAFFYQLFFSLFYGSSSGSSTTATTTNGFSIQRKTSLFNQISSSKMESKHLRPLSTSTPNMKLVPQGSAKTPSSAATDEDNPKNSKKRKAMDFLSCIPVPPPLTPICSTISPSLKKAFQPPRSLGLQRSKSAKETNPNVGFVTPSRKVREAVRVPVNDLVADEELAMINTQALMNTLPEEKKTEGVNENSTIATNLSDDLSPKHSSRAAEEAKNLLKSSSEEAEALQKDAKELGGSLSTHRMLPRRKSRKCY